MLKRIKVLILGVEFILILFALGRLSAFGIRRVTTPLLLFFIVLGYYLINRGSAEWRILDKRQKTHTVIASVLYGVICIIGIDYNYRHLEAPVTVGKAGKILSIPGMIILFVYSLPVLCSIWKKVIASMTASNTQKRVDTKHTGVACFLVIWIVCLIIYLNSFPGSLLSDSYGQLLQAMGDMELENYNPLIHTSIIMLCQRIVFLFSSNALYVVALYTFLQLTLYSLVCTWSLCIITKRFHNSILLIVSLLFFVAPINLYYATGMWKDAFFAICFLAYSNYMIELLNMEEVRLHNLIILGVIVIVTSLARNSGWSALLGGAIVLGMFGLRGVWKTTIKRLLITLGISIVTALCILFVIYPITGIEGINSKTGKSIILQQLSRTIVEGVCSEEELSEINQYRKQQYLYEPIEENYNENLVDPVRALFDVDEIANHNKDFIELWLRIGIRHPKEYALAYIDHTANFWWPDNRYWLVDDRIVDNLYGIQRQPFLFPNSRIALFLYAHIPAQNVIFNSGMVLWIVLFSIYYCNMQGKRVELALIVPTLGIFVGLLLFAYTGQFRYTYASVLAMPLMIVYCAGIKPTRVEGVVH